MKRIIALACIGVAIVAFVSFFAGLYFLSIEWWRLGAALTVIGAICIWPAALFGVFTLAAIDEDSDG